MNSLLALLFSSIALAADPPPLLKVGVIDTGFNMAYAEHVKLCPTGHFNFESNKAEIGSDEMGHGTHVAVTIGGTNKDVNYCLLIYKFTSVSTYKHTPCSAILRAIEEGASVLNLSWGGDNIVKCEEEAIKHAFEKHVVVFAAAGNESTDLDKKCSYYPACYSVKYPNVVSVGSEGNTKANYGSVLRTRAPFCVTNAAGTLCGTSMSTSEATRDYIFYWGLAH